MASSDSISDEGKIRNYLSENIQDLSHIYAAHKKSLDVCDDEISQWKKFIKDYNVLEEKLSTYPDKTSYDEIIPIGSLALMKGRKIHTNEILVHLGENWFAERSVKDAIAIIKRRKEVCIEKLKDVERGKKIHEGWLAQTQKLAEEGKQVEILEKISEEEYEQSKEKHREMVAKHFALLSEGRERNSVSDGREEGDRGLEEEISIPMEMKNFEDVLKRLDVLEEEERIMDELVEAGELEYPEDESGNGADEENRGEGALSGGASSAVEKQRSSSPSGREKLQRRVSWADQLSDPKRDDDEEEEDEEGGEHHGGVPGTVKMTYRARQQSLPAELVASSYPSSWGTEGAEGLPAEDAEEPDEGEEEEEGEEGGRGGEEDNAEGGVKGGEGAATTPQSPSDLYKMFGPHAVGGQPPKGILKKKGESFQSEEIEKGVGWSDTAEYIPSSPDEPVIFRNPPPLSESPKEIMNLKPAFSYKVVARTEGDQKASTDFTTPTEDEEEDDDEEKKEVEEEPRKVSRFKASRMAKKNVED